ncbi:uncharacterized protein LOC103312159 isoform X1 [Tribolium castaneum]|uniref:Uncharacterized protein n=1 Tax=Tribolium castaneum TaxID=7070 RepID=A0A139WNC6_TRICA|nr:PREDICTED: uncharacterized protein LOC103312159 isoform X1 [Tribolium castaneum]KYB29393.1 hypothetical protein TcasGA2_TC032236 [Tribolium castaneum]|eukprot:XP_008190288.1 PREDICTED: uncharacterized protein LOC103312159 isoform X1 [Tribolium castaneum]
MINSAAPGPGFHHSFKFAIVVTVATLLRSCSSAPTMDYPWWYHPCTSSIDRAPERHERSTKHHLEFIKRQYETFLHQLNIGIKNIYKLYKKEQKNTKVPRFKWFNKKKMLKPFDNTKNDVQKRTELHKALQYVAGNLEVLRRLNVTTATDFKEDRRQQIYSNITNHLKLLLCEVYDSFERNQVPAGIPLHKMKIGFRKETDLTRAQMYDLIYFRRLKTFLKALKKKMFKRNKRKKNSEVKNKKRT